MSTIEELFELKGKKIADIYHGISDGWHHLIIEFTDGVKVRIHQMDDEVVIEKDIAVQPTE